MTDVLEALAFGAVFSGMVMALYVYGLEGLWGLIRKALAPVERIVYRLAHGRPERHANPDRIAQLERELLDQPERKTTP